MDLIYAQIELINAGSADVQPIIVRALADTCEMLLRIPQHIATKLRLERQDTRPVRLVDGTLAEVDYVGPIQVRFDGRSCFIGAVVVGDDVLLGAMPMEDMDLVIDPALRRVRGANPDGSRGRA